MSTFDAPRVAGELTFSVAEGRCLEVLAALLGRGRGEVVTVGVKLDTPRPELLAAGARRITRSVARYLCADEGYRERTFLREGRRVQGRVWSPSLGRGFAPRYTRASRSFWLAAAQHLPVLASIDASGDATRKAARVVGDLVVTDGTASGDWVFFALAHAALRTFRLASSEELAIQRRLRIGSPLAALLYPDAGSNRDELRGHFTRLTAPENARLVECVESRIARAWTSYAALVWGSRQSPDDLTQRWSALSRTLHAWLDAVDRARRMDLARPLLRFADGLMAGPFSVGAEAVRAALANAPGLRDLKGRDALLGAAAGVADVAVRLLRLREELAGERYGDDRYEEAQVYVRDADLTLTPLRRQVEGVARALSGVLG